MQFRSLALILGAAGAIGASVAARPAPDAGPPLPILQGGPPADSVSRLRDSLVRAVRQSIQGREGLPAESVYKNLKIFKNFRAGQLLGLMNIGFGRSLGVGCDHCHVVGEWDKDDKQQKQIARDMWAMVGTINTELLPKIQNLKGQPPQSPTVNCTTCHRGQVKPALNLPSP
ncbi:MAG: c-type cytochrome [Gemmatimonadales bacterium]|nr:c-type cytochrome [Gemmatimonadales bacterium]